jgi:hypothetical protein
VRENSDNFRFVPDQLQPEVVEISKIETAAWPIRIRDYMKMRTNLTSALEEVKKELREKITKAYNDAYELLERGCEAENVDKSVFQIKRQPLKLKRPLKTFLPCKTTSIRIAFTKNRLNVFRERKACKTLSA